MTDTTNTAAAGQKMPRKPTGKLAFAYATIMQLEAQVAGLRAAIAAQLEVIGAGGVEWAADDPHSIATGDPC